MKQLAYKQIFIGFMATLMIVSLLSLWVAVKPVAALATHTEENCYDAGGDIFTGFGNFSTGGYLARPNMGPSVSSFCGKICPDGSVIYAELTDAPPYFEFTESCTDPNVRPDAPSDDVNAGGNLDISYGSCGAYITNSPVDGTVGLTRAQRSTAQPPFGVNFLRNGCKASFTSDTGYSGDGTLVTIYFQLNMSEYEKWLDGELTIYFGDAGNWTECPNPFWIDDGSMYGRLACTSSGFNTYFLGTK